MYKGISFYFGYCIDPKKRAKMIKDAGYDCVITNADPWFDSQNGKISKQIKRFKKNGIKLSSLHMRYLKSELPYFFKKGKIGDKIERNLVKDVKLAAKYGFKCVVVHLGGEPNEVGFKRIERVLKVCEKLNMPLAFENLKDDTAFHCVMKEFQHPLVKFCYDAGHNNAFHPEVDYLKLYGDRLICVHLHDNDGTCDAHGLNRFGTINWKSLAKKLAKTDLQVLDYELMPRDDHGMSALETLSECFSQAVELEKMIEKEKVLLNKKLRKKEDDCEKTILD